MGIHLNPKSPSNHLYQLVMLNDSMAVMIIIAKLLLVTALKYLSLYSSSWLNLGLNGPPHQFIACSKATLCLHHVPLLMFIYSTTLSQIHRAKLICVPLLHQNLSARKPAAKPSQFLWTMDTCLLAGFMSRLMSLPSMLKITLYSQLYLLLGS